MDKGKQIIKKYTEKTTWIEWILVILLAFIMMYVFLYKMGTLHSGYHFLDDHELIRMEVSFEDKNASVGEEITKWISNDLRWRYRPLYWVERVCGAYLFGSNMLWWNIYTAIKGVFTFVLLYFAARYLKCNQMVSCLFTGLILYGAQFTPWYRSANQENTGLLLCALTMFLIALQFHNKKYLSKILNIVIVVSAILCGLMKESFTLVIPAFAFMRLYLEYQNAEKMTLIDCLKKHWLMYGTLLVAFGVNLWFVVFQVGVDQVSYAGFHEGTGLADYFRGILNSYQYYLRWYINVAAVLIIILLIGVKGAEIKKYVPLLLGGGYVLVTQLVVHAKSGMWERYLIPWIVGYAAVFVILGYKMLGNTRFYKWIYLLVLCVLVYLQAPMSISKSKDYAWDGRMTALYFQTILDCTDEEDHIICAFKDDELNLSTECWLESRGRTLVYTYLEEKDEMTNKVQVKGKAPAEMNWENARVVTCYENQVESILDRLKRKDPEQYTINVNGNYAVICLK